MFDVGYDTLVTEEAMTRKTAMTAKAKSTTGATSQTAKTTKATAPKEKAKNSVNSPDKKPSADKNADTKFPGFQKRNIAGENVSVKKIGEFGMIVIHYPTTKISDILLSAWNDRGETVFYKKAVKAARIAGVQEQIAEAEKLLQTAAK